MNFIAGFFQINERDGALTQVYAAASPEIEEKNYKRKYFVPYGKVGNPTKTALDESLGEKLYEMTLKILKEKGFNA
jgi:hypothetical protein